MTARLRTAATTARRLVDTHAARRDARRAQMVLGSLLARPEVRAVLAPEVLGYYQQRYAGAGAVGEVAGGEVAA